GQTTVRAVRLTEPLRIDGALDEAVYRTVPPIDGFIQQEPVEGAPSSEPTEAWIFFDADNIYVAARFGDSRPDREIANEMRRDALTLVQNEYMAVFFDTFHDRR